MAAPLVIWDPRMVAYDLGGHHPLHPLRWQLTFSLARQLGVLDGLDTVSPEVATDDEIAKVHSPAYIRAVRAASEPGAYQKVGHGLGTSDNPIFRQMHQAAATIAGGSIMAAKAIARREVDRAVNICGGLHHAMADHASGFCIYNDAALAVRTLLDEGVPRVAYIDVDVHHGDGVQAAFYDDPRVLTVSVHESPLTLFPGTGWPTEIGGQGAAGSSVNVALPAGTDNSGWLRAFHAVVPGIVREFRPDVLVTQQGADSHQEDPLANLLLTVDGHRTIYRALRDLAETVAGGRWLALGGGGYSLVRVVPRSWTHLLAVVAGRELDPQTPIPASWRDEASAARPDIGPPETLTDGEPGEVYYQPWDGHPVGDTRLHRAIDSAIEQSRSVLYPLHGLDPHDPRD